jgi:hypothetical protein
LDRVGLRLSKYLPDRFQQLVDKERLPDLQSADAFNEVLDVLIAPLPGGENESVAEVESDSPDGQVEHVPWKAGHDHIAQNHIKLPDQQNLEPLDPVGYALHLESMPFQDFLDSLRLLRIIFQKKDARSLWSDSVVWYYMRRHFAVTPTMRFRRTSGTRRRVLSAVYAILLKPPRTDPAVLSQGALEHPLGQPHLEAVEDIGGISWSSEEQTELFDQLRGFVERVETLAPGSLLGIVDLSQLADGALSGVASAQPAVFDDPPIAMDLAVLLAGVEAQKHGLRGSVSPRRSRAEGGRSPPAPLRKCEACRSVSYVTPKAKNSENRSASMKSRLEQLSPGPAGPVGRRIRPDRVRDLGHEFLLTRG